MWVSGGGAGGFGCSRPGSQFPPPPSPPNGSASHGLHPIHCRVSGSFAGDAMNVDAIEHLCGPDDVVLSEAFAHNSIVQGCQLSGSKRLSFPHNSFETLDKILTAQRLRYNKALIIIEGIHSADGDIPNLPAFIEVRRVGFQSPPPPPTTGCCPAVVG